MEKRKRDNRYYILLLMLLAFSLAGCRSTKNVAVSGEDVAVLSQLKEMQAVAGSAPGVSAKAKMSFNAGGKSGSVSGTMKMVEGTGVYLSVAPLGLVEVANVAFLPTYVQVVNKLEGEYSQVKYADVALLKNLGLDFSLLESVFMNRIYTPGNKPLGDALKDMDITQDGGNIVLSFASKGITYRYFVETATGLLVRSEGLHSNGTGVTCTYSSFAALDGKQFPTQISLQLAAPGANAALSFTLSRMSTLATLDIPAPSARYKKVGAGDILDSLLGK